MNIGILELDIHLPGSISLKNKRRVTKSLITRLRNKFNISILETNYRDLWQRTVLGIGIVANKDTCIHRNFSRIIDFVEQEKGIYIIGSNKGIL